MGIYIAGKISGAHLNPAVTLALAVFRGFPWRKVLPYSHRTDGGSVCRRGRSCIGTICQPSAKPIRNLNAPPESSRHSPRFPQLPQAGFLDQLIGTGLLVLLIFAIIDEFNMPPGANLAPLMIGLVVVAIGMSFGGMHGYAINPARDFGPRLFTVVAGFRNNGLTDGTHVWWIPDCRPVARRLGRRRGL